MDEYQKKVDQIIGEISAFDDTEELVETVFTIAEDLNPSDAYYLRELAVSLQGAVGKLRQIKGVGIYVNGHKIPKPLTSHELEAMNGERVFVPCFNADNYKAVEIVSGEPAPLYCFRSMLDAIMMTKALMTAIKETN